MLQHHVHAENRSPGMSEQDDLLFLQMGTQELGQLNSVIRHAFNRHCASNGWSARLQALACSTLIPLCYREVLLPRSKDSCQWEPRCTRASVKTEENRIVPILPTNLNPLIDAADLYIHGLFDTVRSMDGKLLGCYTLPVGPEHEDPYDSNQKQQRQVDNDVFGGS